MSPSSSSVPGAPSVPDPTTSIQPIPPESGPSRLKKALYSIGLPMWVFLGFMLAQALVLAAFAGMEWAGVPIDSVDSIILNASVSAVVYALSIFVVIGVPWLVKKRPATKKELGLHRGPNWFDVLWTPAGAIVYIILTSLVTAFAMAYLTFIDYGQTQETGFTALGSRLEYILAFISLVVVAPIAEEILFRGYLLGKLRKYAPLWVAILITSILFALVHFQWNVAVDVFALSIVLCLLRVVSGSVWPAIFLHMLKNGVAFYFLFINPSVLSTLGG